MKASEAIREYIKSKEGLSLTPYPDADGYSIGYGHFLGSGSSGASHPPITLAQANAYFNNDLKIAETEINSFIVPRLNQNQYDALVSFVYNVGGGNFRKSTLLKKINAIAPEHEIQAEFRKWIYSQGKIFPALVDRRNYEADLYAKPLPVITVVQEIQEDKKFPLFLVMAILDVMAILLLVALKTNKK